MAGFLGKSGGGSGIPARFLASLSAVATPGYSFAAETNSGFYRLSSGILGVSIAGVGVTRWATGFFYPEGDGTIDLGHPTLHWKRLYIDYTVTGTVGAVTINKSSGRCIVAAAAASVVVTNSNVTANSIIMVTIAQNDATAVIKNVVAAAGSFTITLNAAATANTAVNFFVVSAD